MLNKGIDFLYISSAKPVTYLSHEKKGEITRDKKFQTSKTKAEESTTDNKNQTSEINYVAQFCLEYIVSK